MRPIKELVLASHNQGKIIELQQLLSPLGIDVLMASQLDVPEPEETGATFFENAKLKAQHAAELSGKPSLGDDSGLIIPSLNGFPGLITGRYAKSFPQLEKCFSDLQQRLSGRKPDAALVCVLCLYFPDGHYLEFEGKLDGRIVFPARGEDGFFFDYVFQPEGEEKTLAELGRDRKNQISHRSIALRKLIDACS